MRVSIAGETMEHGGHILTLESCAVYIRRGSVKGSFDLNSLRISVKLYALISKMVTTKSLE